jgi:hypothetical protein
MVLLEKIIKININNYLISIKIIYTHFLIFFFKNLTQSIFTQRNITFVSNLNNEWKDKFYNEKKQSKCSLLDVKLKVGHRHLLCNYCIKNKIYKNKK